MPGRGEAAHIDADLRDDHLGTQVTDPGDAAQQPDCWRKGPRSRSTSVDLGDGGIQRIDLA